MEVHQWKLRIILQIHFWLIVNACFAKWISDAYYFYNFIFILSLMWVVGSKTSIEPVYTAFILDFSSFLFDLVVIGFFISGVYGTTFAIINAVFRLISLSVLQSEIVRRDSNDASDTLNV